MFPAIAASIESPFSATELFDREKEWMAQTGKQVEKMRGPLQAEGESLIAAMTRYLQEFKEEQVDLTASLKTLDSFLGLLEQVRHEDLPRHEKKFKDRLNDKVSQEVALFNAALRKEQTQIESKILQLNEALGQLEYQPGTIMRLEPRHVQDREIEDFKRSLRECLDELVENSDEANEARFVRIQKLVQQLGDSEKTRWRDKVIDVRNWFTFAAREIEKETGDTRSFHEGSTGQSGGEKAKLAFTILVAAIAYQYDLDPEGRTPGRFGFVVVDEMFSKIDDQNANYALRLFEQFGLQLLIVAPLDAKARVTEPFVDSYLQVVKDESTGRSQLFCMTAKEYEEVVQGFPSNGQPSGRIKAAK
ncbi:MAG: SbcC/MukB-like Walker B domain-containing protein [Aeoliella sp.]